VTEAAAIETPTQPKPILGVAQIMTDVLAVFFKRLPKVLLLALPGGIVFGGLFYLAFIEFVLLWDGGFGRGGSLFLDLLIPFFLFATCFGSALGIVAAPLAAAMSEFNLHRTVTLRKCFAALRRNPIAAILLGTFVIAMTLVPLLLLSFAGSGRSGLFLGLVALAVGAYMLGLWGIALPSISKDKLGLSALGRSKRLGGEYRWPIAGTCFLLFFTSVLFGGAVGALLAAGFGLMVYEVLDLNVSNDLLDTLMFFNFCIGQTIAITLLGLGLASVRERLVEIKEPPDIANMIHVFD
jgi:hypothetical protein